MASYTIEKLEQVLSSYINGSVIVNIQLSKLTSAGDNYGGALLAVEVTTRDGKKQEQLRLVAKLLPENEYVQKLFNSQRTFRNEVGFYETIVPCLKDFQKERGFTEVFNSTPAFYGARFSLDPSSTKVDANAVLLIKNLKDEGFNTIDRKVGFDLEQSQLIFDKLAEIHATSFALKLLKPDTFKEHIGPFVQEFTIFESNNGSDKALVNSLLDLLKDDDTSVRNWTKIKTSMEENCAIIGNKNKNCNNQFVGLVHSDLWSNNIMIKFENYKMVDVKFVDFQLYEYASLARDIVFFLFTSVQLEVLKEHCDSLITFYYNRFINFLKKLQCDSFHLSFETFLSEINSASKEGEFLHVMLMLRSIYIDAENTKEVEEMKPNDYFISHASKACQQKACYVVHEFIRRGWI